MPLNIYFCQIFKQNDFFITSGFSFHKFTFSDIKKGLDQLPSSHLVSLKYTQNFLSLPQICIPILHILFNECLNLKSIPDNLKLALVNPLYKTKIDR